MTTSQTPQEIEFPTMVEEKKKGGRKPATKKTAAPKKKAEPKKRVARTLPKREPKPPAPKKLSGFMKFRLEHQARVKEENPDDSAGQIGKRLGEMWRSLSKEEQAAYMPPKPVKPSVVEAAVAAPMEAATAAA